VQVDRVFVYGTLKRGEQNHGLIAPYLIEAAPASLLDHTLLACDWCPGARPAPGERIEGEVMLIREPRAALAVLDRLEEHPTWYRRRRSLVLEGERRVRAWWYELVRIDDGWRPHGARWP
jgi:gamma-glutamylcyclotransferase (GGCT)/AIG2-like uncharacterized protein YtfP